MKALEKATEDRGKTPTASSQAERELTLEALDSKPGALPGYGPAASRNAASADRTRSSAQINAATVLGARQPSGAGVLAWMQSHPLYVFGGLAGWFLLLYAIYVYVQITHPGWLTRTPPTASVVATTPKPPPAMPNAALRGNDDNSAAPPAVADTAQVPLPSVFSGAGALPPAAPAPDTARDRNTSANVAALPAPRVIAPPQTAAAPSERPIERIAPQNRIAVSRGDTAAPRVNPAVSEAYAALEAGQFETAQRLYSQALKNDPANVDALLGLAALAQKDNRPEDAQRYFMSILEANPRHALAQSGLISLMGRADPQAAESRLKQLLAREPSAPLHFNLGNLYADQGLSPQAQQAYFHAHNLEPGNPDYAYNLAVGLEHLGQQKLALGFYRKAQQLASVRGSANFDTARIQERITQLSTRFE